MFSEKSWVDFDSYKYWMKKVYLVRRSDEHYLKSTCTCMFHATHFYCQHTMALELHLQSGRLNLRKEAIRIKPFDQKKSGRKKKRMSAALVKDTDESDNSESASDSSQSN